MRERKEGKAGADFCRLLFLFSSLLFFGGGGCSKKPLFPEEPLFLDAVASDSEIPSVTLAIDYKKRSRELISIFFSFSSFSPPPLALQRCFPPPTPDLNPSLLLSPQQNLLCSSSTEKSGVWVKTGGGRRRREREREEKQTR